MTQTQRTAATMRAEFAASAAGDKLLAAAVAALALPAAQRAAHLRAKLKSELTWHLLERFAPRVLEEAIADLLRDAAEMAAAARVGDAGRGQTDPDTLLARAPAGATSPHPQGEQPSGRSGAAHWGSGNHKAGGRPSSLINTADAAARRERQREAIQRVAVRHSRLDELRCNGVPLGDLTAGEARAWARETGRNARFVEIVTSGLQPNMRIRDVVRPEEADEAWSRSGEVQ